MAVSVGVKQNTDKEAFSLIGEISLGVRNFIGFTEDWQYFLGSDGCWSGGNSSGSSCSICRRKRKMVAVAVVAVTKLTSWH